MKQTSWLQSRKFDSLIFYQAITDGQSSSPTRCVSTLVFKDLKKLTKLTTSHTENETKTDLGKNEVAQVMNIKTAQLLLDPPGWCISNS